MCRDKHSLACVHLICTVGQHSVDSSGTGQAFGGTGAGYGGPLTGAGGYGGPPAGNGYAIGIAPPAAGPYGGPPASGGYGGPPAYGGGPPQPGADSFMRQG